MNSVIPTVHRGNLFHVRPVFLLIGASFLIPLLLPGALIGGHAVQSVFLALAGLAILLGWFFLLQYREPHSIWRAAVAAVTSVCLTASLPVFFFELSRIRSHHPVLAIYVRPWIHWGYQGYVPVLWGVAGSFFGRGWARIAFVAGGVLVLTLRNSMGIWVA